MSPTLRALASLTALLLLHCSGEEQRPKELLPFPIDNSKSCSQVRGGSAQKGRVIVDGEIARCFPDGLACAVDDVSAFDGVCDGEKAVEARCEQGFWALTCTDRGDSGTP
ncbi:MAG TPA: hypothetical protein PKA88_39740 [Polyangiaceae bacterium]|nr:hypothetical protein [Polyangiaceae bacterium]HMR73933.1 hypothetical protein [Polyangiaceae bacterium]